MSCSWFSWTNLSYIYQWQSLHIDSCWLCYPLSRSYTFGKNRHRIYCRSTAWDIHQSWFSWRSLARPRSAVCFGFDERSVQTCFNTKLTRTPYNPICNGLVERFNGKLKQILKKLCSEHPQDWDRYLPALLFSYREATQESLGFSPFELLYGRTLRGPMQILKNLWSKEV